MPKNRSGPTDDRSLYDLAHDPQNANKGTARGREALAMSLQEYGPGRGVLIDRHGTIIAGNKTVEEAKRLNIPLRVVKTDGDVLVAVQREDLDLKTDTRAKQLAIADNRIGQLDLEWDVEMLKRLQAEGLDLSAFWTADEFATLFAEPTTGLTDENTVVEPAATDIVRGDLFVLESHRLLCGDATSPADVARVLDGATPNLMATDPPYGVSYDPSWRHRMNPKQRTAVGRVLNDDCAMWAAVFQLFLGRDRLCVACRAQGQHGRSGPGGRRLLDSQSDYLGQTAFRPQPRRLPLGPRARLVRRPGQGAVARRPSPDDRLGSPQPERDGRRTHRPTTRSPGTPRKSPYGCSRSPSSTTPSLATRVYDPFVGSGTMVIAAEKTGRTAFAMDLDPRYVQATITRWEQFTGKHAKRLGRPTARRRS